MLSSGGIRGRSPVFLVRYACVRRDNIDRELSVVIQLYHTGR